MMTRCAHCSKPLLKVKEVLNLKKISWFILEFDCPFCQAPLTTNSFWEGAFRITGYSSFTVSFSAVFLDTVFLVDAVTPFTLGVMLAGLALTFYSGIKTRTSIIGSSG